ncbi:hypothetical protein ACFQS1_17060, partial [Paractinoplanes rhizophilus]
AAPSATSAVTTHRASFSDGMRAAPSSISARTGVIPVVPMISAEHAHAAPVEGVGRQLVGDERGHRLRAEDGRGVAGPGGSSPMDITSPAFVDRRSLASRSFRPDFS